eukprot:m.263567 g.263567  ORF g.263567 m.263567 type:complete len:214 (-) comp51012_c0_seq1:36-677(-)
MDDFDDVEEDASAPIKTLQQAWINEKSAPEILKYATEEVDTLLQLVEEQDVLSREKAKENVTTQFLFNVYQMEITRIKYLIRSYLRTRLKKIERFAIHILTTDDGSLKARLSPQELLYAQGYRQSLETHMQSSCLGQLPDKFSKMDVDTKKQRMIVKPHRDKHVFCLVEDNLGAVQVGLEQDSESMPMSQGDTVIVRYDVIESYLLDNRVSLL